MFYNKKKANLVLSMGFFLYALQNIRASCLLACLLACSTLPALDQAEDVSYNPYKADQNSHDQHRPRPKEDNPLFPRPDIKYMPPSYAHKGRKYEAERKPRRGPRKLECNPYIRDECRPEIYEREHQGCDPNKPPSAALEGCCREEE